MSKYTVSTKTPTLEYRDYQTKLKRESYTHELLERDLLNKATLKGQR